eukprot:2596581-Amphidinium_carterae.1
MRGNVSYPHPYLNEAQAVNMHKVHDNRKMADGIEAKSLRPQQNIQTNIIPNDNAGENALMELILWQDPQQRIEPEPPQNLGAEDMVQQLAAAEVDGSVVDSSIGDGSATDTLSCQEDADTVAEPEELCMSAKDLAVRVEDFSCQEDADTVAEPEELCISAEDLAVRIEAPSCQEDADTVAEPQE